MAKAITINIVSHLLKTHKVKLLIASLILIGAFLRFYNLNWGSPFYFHPDERNIVDLVLKSSLANPETLLKGTFAYGNFPVILTLLLKPLFLLSFQVFKLTDAFAQTAIILRTISAVFSILTIYVIYLCGKFWSQKVALLALFLSVFSTGLIQQAHFGTYDGLGAFCAITVFYFILRFLRTKRIINYYISILFLAIGAAAKINLLILAIFPVAILLTSIKKQKSNLLPISKHSILGMLLLISLTALFSPNYLAPEFRAALFYERSLVAGITPVFYTQSFYNTPPVIFQFLHILPFLINPVLTAVLVPAFFYLVYKAIKTKNQPFLLLTSYFLLLFLPQAFLYAKWTRYMVPTLPFVYLIVSIFVSDFLQSFKKVFSIKPASPRLASTLARGEYLVLSIFTLTSVIFSMSYFITAFVQPDTRIAASKFSQNNIAQSATILTEPYDLGIIPFNSHLLNIHDFNFYDLDPGRASLDKELSTKLSQSDYIILPSQRLLRSRLLNASKFPKGYGFYSLLTKEAAGYQKIYETPCDIFCNITYLGNPVFSFEETASVFERPTVFIFKKLR